MPSLLKRLEKAEREITKQTELAALPDYSRYARDPVGFARDVLKIEPTPDQAAIAEALLQPPYRVLVKAGHNVGKSFLMAWLVVWWYFTRPISTALTTSGGNFQSVCDIVWGEVRLLMARAKLPDTFIGPVAPQMRTSPDHWAKGMNAATGEGFQGRHRAHAFFGFDEAEGLQAVYWKTTDTMFQPDGTNAVLAILNPTTTTSQSYQEEQAVDIEGNPKWRVFTLSSLEHPNVKAGLEGRPLPVPNAVSLDQVWGWIADSFEEIPADEVDEDLDIEFPPGSGRWWRPDPEGEARVLGRRPTAGTYGVWSERAWKRAAERLTPLEIPIVIPEIGHDSARFGDDRSETHVRQGPCSLHHEDHGGWDTVQQANRLMELADLYARKFNAMRPSQAEPIDGKAIPIKVDDTGVGGGVTDILRANGYNVVPINAGSAPHDKSRYPRLRDELWFTVRDMVKKDRLDFTRLDKKRLNKLKPQFLAPTWKPTPNRQRVVEPKEETKKRLKRSPDGPDAVNLAYYHATSGEVATVIDTGKAPNWRERHRR